MGGGTDLHSLELIQVVKRKKKKTNESHYYKNRLMGLLKNKNTGSLFLCDAIGGLLLIINY